MTLTGPDRAELVVDLKALVNVHDPFPLYRWLRDHDPVHWSEPLNAWAITRYADVLEVFAQPIRFSSDRFRKIDSKYTEHHSWTAAADQAPFEIETLGLIEVDAEGRIVAILSFDPEDRRAASTEMLERYARSDEARDIPAAVFDALRAVNAHELEGVRATLRHDFVLNDHRRTGLGRLGAEDYLASLAALFEQAPEVGTEILYVVAVERHGVLMLARNFGTLREGGEFESLYVRIMLYQDNRLIGVEMFEPEDLDLARARFEELRGGPADSQLHGVQV